MREDPGPQARTSGEPFQLGPSAATLLAIFLGGALGTVARFALDTTHTNTAGHFPVDTLLINLSGSLAIGFLMPLLEGKASGAAWGRPFLVIGVLGGWTTYSALVVDAVQLAQRDHPVTMVVYLAATVVGGVVAVLIGQLIARRVVTSS